MTEQDVRNRFRIIRIWKQIDKLVYLPTETEIEKVNNIVREMGMNFHRDYIKKLLTAYKYALCHTHYKTGRNMIEDICQGRKIYIKSYVSNNNAKQYEFASTDEDVDLHYEDSLEEEQEALDYFYDEMLCNLDEDEKVEVFDGYDD